MKSLASKMCEVMKRVRYIQKTGRNTFHKYSFLEESELVERIGEAMAEVGIAYFPEVIDVQHIPDPKDKGILTTIRVAATFACSETGETHTVQWAGVGHDALDKGIYKAMTGANKYLLMKTFLISTGDDPEQDAPAQRDEPRQQQREDRRQRNQPNQQRSQQQPPQDDAHTNALRRLYAVLGEVCGDDKDLKERVAAMIKHEEGVRLVKDLTAAQLHQWSGIITPDWLKRALGGV